MFPFCWPGNSYQLYEDHTVFVMWNWAWLEEISSSDDDRSVCSDNLKTSDMIVMMILKVLMIGLCHTSNHTFSNI